uniref:Jade family PHD finger 3 n=1 Tax=Ornithorhynchus anatinus TaxID=9258 RepID=A0A6I8NMA7_ORNAN
MLSNVEGGTWDSERGTWPFSVCFRMKRQRHLSSSGSSDNESPSTSFSSCLKYRSKSKTAGSEPKKPAEVFRKDLISAMKLPDSHHVNPEEYYLFADTWKEEWEKGVQVPSCPASIPQPSLRYLHAPPPRPMPPIPAPPLACRVTLAESLHFSLPPVAPSVIWG